MLYEVIQSILLNKQQPNDTTLILNKNSFFFTIIFKKLIFIIANFYKYIFV